MDSTADDTRAVASRVRPGPRHPGAPRPARWTPRLPLPSPLAPTDSRWPRGALEWSIVALIAYQILCVFPFVLRFFFWELNKPLRVVTIGVVFLLLVRTGIDRSKTALLTGNRTVMVFALFYFGYLLCLTAASLLSYEAYPNWVTGVRHNPIINLGGLWLLTLTALALFVSIDVALYRWILDRFTDLLVICSLLAIILTPLLYWELIEPIGYGRVIQEGADRFAHSDVHLRFYGLGFHRDYTVIAGMRLPRAQSFAHEGAGFAYPLFVGIAWGLWRKRLYSVATMVVALVLTWSMGVFVFSLSLPLVLALRAKRSGVLLTIAVLMVAAFGALELLDFTAFREYFEERYASPQSSFAGRVADWKWILDAVEDNNWMGYGAGAVPNVFPVTIATTVVAVLGNAGLPGLLCWACGYLVLAAKVGRYLIWGSDEASYWALMVGLLYFMSWQGPGIDSSVFSWFLVVSFLHAFAHAESVALDAQRSAPVITTRRRGTAG